MPPSDQIDKIFINSLSSLLKKKSYADAYTFIVTKASTERGVPLDQQTITRGQDLITQKKDSGHKGMLLLFGDVFSEGVRDSGAPKTSELIKKSVAKSQSSGIGTALLILVPLGLLFMAKTDKKSQ